MTNDERYDVLIIGAGPSGLACAIEAKMAGMRYVVVDRGGVVESIQRFQRDMFFFSTPELLEIGGIPFIIPATRPTSLDCVNYYRRVADHYNLECRFYEEVRQVERIDGGFIVDTSRGRTYTTRTLIVATGYYDTPNQLDVPGERLPHVSHFYRDPLPYYRQDVLIVGGKNSAVEAALDLWRHGARVTVVHRGPALSKGVKYWILPDFENRVAAGSIKLHFETTIREFRPEVTVLADAGGRTSELRTDFAFGLIGYRPDLDFLRMLGISIDPDTLAPLHNPATMETNIRGIFVAGGMVGGKFNNKIFIENGREHRKAIIPAVKTRL